MVIQLNQNRLVSSLVAISLVLMISISSVYAAGKPTKSKQQTIGDLECVMGEVAKMQDDGSWACGEDIDTKQDKSGIEALVGTHTVDTNAATECGLGEVLMADGGGGGACVNLENFVLETVFPSTSTCPCNLVGVTAPALTFSESTVCLAADTGYTDPQTPVTVGHYILMDESTGDGVFVTQLDLTDTTCVVSFINNPGLHQYEQVVGASQVSDCFADLQTVADAAGIACPEPPTFVFDP